MFRNHVVLVLLEEEVRLVNHLASIVLDSEVCLGALGLRETLVVAEGAVELGGKGLVRGSWKQAAKPISSSCERALEGFSKVDTKAIQVETKESSKRIHTMFCAWTL